MSLSASEQATLHFYEWEYRNRGYYHFDTPVDIEPPYIPFQHKQYNADPIIDDGRVPSIFSSIGKFLNPPKEEQQEEETILLEPTLLRFDELPKLIGFSLAFPHGQEIIPLRNREFLNMLSFTTHPVSFEIIGTADDIKVQIVTSESDKDRIYSHLRAYFPASITQEIDVSDFGFDVEQDIAIADFGVHDEFMRPIAVYDSFAIDPLTSVIATLDSLHEDDIAVFQILFKGITSPLAKDIPYSVVDGVGGSFFSDAPEMPNCAMDKISAPLFSVVMRIAAQGKTDHRSRYLAQELARSITGVSSTQYNKLIPLSNEGYPYDFHQYNVHHRLSNRLGFILNSKELSTFVHYPNRSVVSAKLGLSVSKSKKLPKEAINQKYVLGRNVHNGIEKSVSLNDQARLRHTHIIGATGTGKSTLLANMVIEDMKHGNGCVLLDPHGDIVDDILLRIPEHRKDDVILIDPSDTEYPIGFNVLQANTDAQKIVLSSDLVSAFKRHSNAWGDNMTAVLSNAINTFLESDTGGTIIELKRFLLEDSFRKEFLLSVDDPSIHYYWNNEYYMVRKGIAPLLTRIDTFLRPKVIRYMLAQNSGIDFGECIERKKIILIKLSQGLIGEENSFLLGSLFLSKINQVAQGRQSLAKSERHPYYIYLDEFQNFITPSITRILSGARKYGLGLTLAHQELGQIDDPKILNSVISNPHTRICFRLGDTDAKRLESGFSYFEQSDLQSLATGQTIGRLGSFSNDFNLATFPLSEPTNQAGTIKEHIVNGTRSHYAKTRTELEELLTSLLPKASSLKNKDKRETKTEVPKSFEKTEPVKSPEPIPTSLSEEQKESALLEIQKQSFLKEEEEKERLQKHRFIQNYIKTLASPRGFISSIEHEIDTGRRIDVVLSKNKIGIAFEVSVTNSIDYEVQNIQKCIEAGYLYVCMVSESTIHLKNIKKRAKEHISKEGLKAVRFFAPSEIASFLDSFEKKKKSVKRVRGYRVKSHYTNVQGKDAEDKGATLKNILLRSLRKDSKKKQ